MPSAERRRRRECDDQELGCRCGPPVREPFASPSVKGQKSNTSHTNDSPSARLGPLSFPAMSIRSCRPHCFLKFLSKQNAAALQSFCIAVIRQGRMPARCRRPPLTQSHNHAISSSSRANVSRVRAQFPDSFTRVDTLARERRSLQVGVRSGTAFCPVRCLRCVDGWRAIRLQKRRAGLSGSLLSGLHPPRRPAGTHA